MISRLRYQLLTLAVLVTTACGHTEEAMESSAMEQRFDSLRSVEAATSQLPYETQAAMVAASYARLFSSVHIDQILNTLSSRDLGFWYRAAYMRAAYTLDERHIQDMVTLLGVLQHRGAVSNVYYAYMHALLIKARMLPAAREFAQLHSLPELEEVPEVREAMDLRRGDPTELEVDADHAFLLRRNVDLHQPAQVVVVSHPLCHFSQAAAQQIHNDPVLGMIFRSHAKWLAPQDGHLDLDAFREWNRDHPDQTLSLTFKREEWPMIDSWRTPTFYFFKDGVLSAKVEGWPMAGRRTELIAALRNIHLLQ